MKILAAGLDAVTVAFLRQHGGADVSRQDISGTDDLREWLLDGVYDAGVIDLERSGLGIYAARGIRSRKITAAIIGVSAGDGRAWGDHRAMFLENGGDDLLRAPVNPRELLASLRACTRRAHGALLDMLEYRFGDAVLRANLAQRTFAVNGVDVYLTAREASVMMTLASNPARDISKEAIMSALYSLDTDEEPEIKIVDVFVCKLRRKLSELHPDAGKLIQTIWGRGYRMSMPPEAKVAA